MKKKLFCFILIGLVLSTSACGKKKKENENPQVDPTPVVEEETPKANVNPDVIKNVDIDGININNVSIITKSGVSTYTANFTNTTENPIDLKSFNLIMKDADGNVVASIVAYVGMTLQPGHNFMANINSGQNLTAVTSIEYTRNY